MLNYIWLALILVGILTAIGWDLYDIKSDKYRNGAEIKSDVIYDNSNFLVEKNKRYNFSIKVSKSEFERIYGVKISKDLIQKATLIFIDNKSAYIEIYLDSTSPHIWFEQSRAQKVDGSTLQGKLYFQEAMGTFSDVKLVLNSVKFVKLNSVTNEGIVKYARIAVEISIGLIGIMSLWLGLMKIAESSGLIKIIAKSLKPITVKLFPDVPDDHPAIGAMVMNISANILGLANAATPLGLKAMEELNKLNKKLGTATDAMCTFLVINTSNVQLIPATVIAIRAASGSVNPTEILGPVIVATSVSTIIGIIAVKLLSKLKVFRKQLEGN